MPYFENTSKEFRDAVSRFDATAGREGLDGILSSARKEDALTLWHLLTRTSGVDRDRVVQQFASLIPGVDSSGLKAGNSNAIDQAWNSLGLGETSWWRTWKQAINP